MERFKAYFAFEGRASRLDYWRISLLIGVVGSGFLITSMLLLVGLVGRAAGVLTLLILPFIVAAVAVSVRRLHDRNRTGWWLIAYYVAPLALSGWVEAQGEAGLERPEVVAMSFLSLGITLWTWIDLGFLSGTPGANRYGADPKAPKPEEVFG